jgi:Ca2+/Na+ antiporter
METKGEGWLIFASIALGVAGIMRIFDAIWAFRINNQTLPDGILGSNIRNYAWVWLIVGILLILCAFAISQRSQMARWIGIIAGAVCAITSIWWMPYYPIWSLTYVAIGVLVVYALAAYGGRDREVVA